MRIERFRATSESGSGATLGDAEFVLSHAWGGGDGCLRTFCEVTAQAPATMTVDLAIGWGFVANTIAKWSATTVTFTPADRTDLIQYTKGLGINVKEGSIVPDADSLGLASITLTGGMTEITADEITDKRSYV